MARFYSANIFFFTFYFKGGLKEKKALASWLGPVSDVLRLAASESGVVYKN